MSLARNILVFLSLFIHQPCNANCEDNEIDRCSLPGNLSKEIDSYAEVVNLILNEVVNGTWKGKTWHELATFVDKFGSRMAGTENLENAIDYMLNRSQAAGLDNVHGEEAVIPHWVRGKESATLIEPRQKDIAMLGLGYSVGTPKEGITAEAIVVKSFAELKKRSKEGASEAAKLGAVAVLIRSITPFSLYSPHTGMMSYQKNVSKIPAACITVEDAALLNRMADRGEKLVINVTMEAQNLPSVQSRNGIAEITGSDQKQKVVVVSGHIDSWDVGQGAMDDGGGLFISWTALLVLRSLQLQPRRTIRAIMWTSEEMGIIGAHQYIKEHKNEERNLQLVMESDIGTFTPIGLEYTGTAEARCILERVMSLMEPINATQIRSPQGGPDIEEWVNSGVPGASLWNRNSQYFWYHHSNADTMDVESPDALDLGTALFAAVSYVMADLSADLPHQ